jgi:predicted phage tail protein
LASVSGNLVGESEWRSFSIVEGKPLVLRFPTQKHEVTHWGSGANFTFAWENDPEMNKNENSQYLFEVLQGEAQETPWVAKKLRLTQIPASQLQLKDGEYHWRVKVINAQGEVLKTSQTRSFRVGVHPPLRAPASEKSFPQSGAIVNYQENPSGPVARWESVEGAKAYEFKLSKGSQLVFTKKTETNQLPLGQLPEGKYQWSVRAIDPIQRTGEALPARSLEVTYGRVLKAPKLKLKEVQ